MLVASISLVLPTFLICFIPPMYQMDKTITVNWFEGAVNILEILVFSSLFIYHYVLKLIYNDQCSDSGTVVGSIVILPIYFLGLLSMILSVLMLLIFIAWAVNECIVRRVCCH